MNINENEELEDTVENEEDTVEDNETVVDEVEVTPEEQLKQAVVYGLTDRPQEMSDEILDVIHQKLEARLEAKKQELASSFFAQSEEGNETDEDEGNEEETEEMSVVEEE